MHIALLTAAGTGERMGLDTPKQFLLVDGRFIIVHTMGRFERHPNIDAIMVVTIGGCEEKIWAWARELGISKLRWVVPGGATGQESIRSGLEALIRDCTPSDVVTIHDGNRPLVSQEIISDSLAVFHRRGSAVACIPCVEAMLRSKDGLSSTESVLREELRRTQTPHTYSLGKLLWAHDEAARRGIAGTAATCTLMQELGETVWFSRGSELNLKITTQDDLAIFRALLAAGLPEGERA